MRALKIFFLALTLSAAGFTLPAQFASAQTASSLTGVWRGIYWGAGNQPTQFQATLQSAGGSVSGSIVEDNNFSDQQVPFLLATLQGNAQGGQLRFTKTYDGTGGVSHSVTYQGRILSNGRRITGTWTAGEATGNFEMAR